MSSLCWSVFGSGNARRNSNRCWPVCALAQAMVPNWRQRSLSARAPLGVPQATGHECQIGTVMDLTHGLIYPSLRKFRLEIAELPHYKIAPGPSDHFLLGS